MRYDFGGEGGTGRGEDLGLVGQRQKVVVDEMVDLVLGRIGRLRGCVHRRVDRSVPRGSGTALRGSSTQDGVVGDRENVVKGREQPVEDGVVEGTQVGGEMGGGLHVGFGENFGKGLGRGFGQGEDCGGGQS